jgi:hypothetical protein
MQKRSNDNFILSRNSKLDVVYWTNCSVDLNGSTVMSVIGSNNDLKCGTINNLSGSNNDINGNVGTIRGSNNTVYGDVINVQGSNNDVFGAVSGNVQGSNNTISGAVSGSVQGSNNTVQGNDVGRSDDSVNSYNFSNIVMDGNKVIGMNNNMNLDMSGLFNNIFGGNVVFGNDSNVVVNGVRYNQPRPNPHKEQPKPVPVPVPKKLAFTGSTEDKETEDNSKQCSVCLSNEKRAVFLPCMHQFCCECSLKLIESKKEVCYFCRGKVEDIRRVHDT